MNRIFRRMDKFKNLSSLDFLTVDAKVFGWSLGKFLKQNRAMCINNHYVCQGRTPGKKLCLNDRNIWNYKISVYRSVLERVKEGFLEK